MIYFIRARGSGHIKIGTTIRLSQRLKQLACEYGDELEVLAITEGSFDREGELHGRFAHLRAAGEWFEPGDDLIGFIVSEGRPWDGEDEAPDIAVKMDAEVIRKAKIVAAYEGKTLADYLSDELGKIIDQRLDEAHAREVGAAPKPGKGKGGAK